MWWMDCRAKFGPLQLDFYCVKPCKGKTVDLGVFFVLLGVGWGPLGSWRGEMASRDVDEAQGCG